LWTFTTFHFPKPELGLEALLVIFSGHVFGDSKQWCFWVFHLGDTSKTWSQAIWPWLNLSRDTVGMSGSIGSIRILSIIGVVNNPELMLQVTGCFSCQPLAASR
jgi:hypothetical protein